MIRSNVLPLHQAMAHSESDYWGPPQDWIQVGDAKMPASYRRVLRQTTGPIGRQVLETMRDLRAGLMAETDVPLGGKLLAVKGANEALQLIVDQRFAYPPQRRLYPATFDRYARPDRFDDIARAMLSTTATTTTEVCTIVGTTLVRRLAFYARGTGDTDWPLLALPAANTSMNNLASAILVGAGQAGQTEVAIQGSGRHAVSVLSRITQAKRLTLA